MRLVITTSEFKITAKSVVKNGNVYVPSLLIKKKEGNLTIQV
jgi:hypothetical protein